MLNKVIVMGRLTRDPELRHTQSGTAVTSFSIACERDFKQENGERRTDFFDIIAWRNTAEFVGKYFAKGRMIVVEGSLQVREWQDKEGNKRRNTEIVASSVYFGDSKSSNGNNVPVTPAADNQTPSGYSNFSEIEEANEDDLPF